MSKVEIRNDNRKHISQETTNLIVKALTQCGMIAEGHAKMNLTRQKAVDTGALRNSVNYKVVDEGDSHTCYVGSNMEYAPYIEFGTGKYVAGGRRTKWKYQDSKGEWHQTEGMEARPFLKPAVTEHADEYKNIIQSTVKM